MSFRFRITTYTVALAFTIVPIITPLILLHHLHRYSTTALPDIVYPLLLPSSYLLAITIAAKDAEAVTAVAQELD